MLDLGKLEWLISMPFEDRGFSRQGPFAERHGSWELTFHKRSRDLDRFVSVAVTQITPSHSYDVEVRAGAEDGKHFARHSVIEFRVPSYELLLDALKGKLQDTLKKAMVIAEGIRPKDLEETYPFPRSAR